MAEFTWNWDAPLEKATGETRRAWEALQDYIDMGPGRSLPLLSKGYSGELVPGDDCYDLFTRFLGQSSGGGGEKPPSRHMSTLEGWSARFQWQARVNRYLELAAARREAIRAQRVQELAEQDWNLGQNLRTKAGELLAEFDKFKTRQVKEIVDENGDTLRIITVKLNATLSQLAQLAKTASDLQRLAVDEPTNNIGLSGAVLERAIQYELERLAGLSEKGTLDATQGNPDADVSHTGADST